jgi:hypothetical protein
MAKPETRSIFDLPLDEATEAAADAAADAEIETGKGVAKGERVPPPEA